MANISEILEEFRDHYQYEKQNNRIMNCASWRDQEGYLLSNNDMKQVEEAYSAMLEGLEDAKEFGWRHGEMEALIKKAKGL